MLEDTNSLDAAHIILNLYKYFEDGIVCETRTSKTEDSKREGIACTVNANSIISI